MRWYAGPARRSGDPLRGFSAVTRRISRTDCVIGETAWVGVPSSQGYTGGAHPRLSSSGGKRARFARRVLHAFSTIEKTPVARTVNEIPKHLVDALHKTQMLE